MTLVRIVCKAPPPVKSAAGMFSGMLPSAVDARVYLVSDDGTEHEIPGVTRVVWTVACDGEPARASLEIEGVEADVDAIGRSMDR